MNKNPVSRYIFFLPLVLVLGLWAQALGTLSGTVTNSAGAAVSNATITITPVNGGAAQKALSGQDGKFSITGLPAGTYRVEVESSGYRRESIENVDLNAANAASLRIQLQQGNTRETVQVQGSAVLVQAESGQTANAIDSRTVTQLPLLDRNHEQLVDLEPGITPPRTNPMVTEDPQQSRYWETNGLPDTANRKTLDGVENREPFTGQTAYLTPVENVDQLNLITSNYDAQFGRAAGAILNPVTRAGTNQIHGSLFEFNSNSALAARNFFDPQGYPQAHSNVNQTGGSVGGPIHRDTTFFFLNFEGDFTRSQVPTLSTTPTDALRSGDFSGVQGLALYNPNTGLANGINRIPFPNNVIPANMISPASRQLLNYFPEPNAGGLQYNLLSNVPITNDGYRGGVRFDHKLGDTLNLFLRYNYGDFMTNQASALGILGDGGDGHLISHNVMAGGTFSASPSLVADIRLGFTRYANKLNASYSGVNATSIGLADPSSALIASSGFSSLGLPQIQIGGVGSFGANASLPQYNVDNNWNLVNSWSVIKGRNSVRSGFDLYYIQAYGYQNYAFGPQGGFIFSPGATASPTGSGLGPYGDYANSFAAFLLGTPTQSGRNLPVYTPGYTTWQASSYAADTLRLTDRFTVDLGVRWEVFSPLALRHENGSFSYSPLTNQLTPLGNGIDNTGNMQIQWSNFAPRIGLAYRAPGRMVIRAGYGINYFAGPLSFYAGLLITNPGIASGGLAGFQTAGSFKQLPAIPAFTGSTSAPNTPLIFSPTNMRTPYVQNFDFLIEHDLGHYGLVASVGYVGNLGRELPYSWETNAAAAGAGAAGQPLNTAAFGDRTASTVERLTGLTSNYNSLQAKLTKRFSNSLSFTAAYTYSRALDYGAGGVTPLLNNLNVASNYGPADWDRTHMFTLSHVWRLPFGADSNFLNEGVIGKLLGPWQLDGVFHWVAGTPFTITADPTLCNCPGNTATASTVVNGVSTGFIPIPTFFGFLPIPYQSLNFVYTQPPAGTLGNLGRNSVRGPGFANYDLALFRSFSVHERAHLEFRAEAYNIANATHFSNPIANVNSVNFGQSISTLPYNPDRRLQLGLRIVF